MTKKQPTLSLQDEFDQLDRMTMGQLRKMSRSEIHATVRRSHLLSRQLGAIPDDISDSRALNELWHMPVMEQISYMADMLDLSKQELSKRNKRPHPVRNVLSPFTVSA